jgi:hypothetical protein
MTRACVHLQPVWYGQLIFNRPSAITKLAADRNEYGLETMCVLQLTALASLQPDLQFMWDLPDNAATEGNLVFHLLWVAMAGDSEKPGGEGRLEKKSPAKALPPGNHATRSSTTDCDRPP